MDTVREKFEAWFSDDGLSPKAIERRGDDYKLMQAQSAWRTWQAAFARAQEEVAEQCKDAERFRWIEENARTQGGGHGFTVTAYVPVDHEDIGCAIDVLIAQEAQK